ncbi:MAG: Lysylphosphatidylglycerol synthase TM region [Candidatus Argoarchaeum ethanivorans]|uniref:Lysylphosphatidylglycerol synthase TM region n=1 Tax=Candidatus Argoarchaeum ethanivorans TaxID=2608793 RepID=A0A811TBS2_9EURY|nr:MAG: Lysylphosphatidylglycerol synthase TM region [Candidatus Argoarchaeum ethanivorans]
MKTASYRKIVYFLLQALAGIAIIAYITLYKLDLTEITVAIKNIHIAYFVLAALAYFIHNLLFSYRLSYLLQHIGHKIAYTKVLISHLGGMLVADITPGRSGYLLTPAFIKKITGARATDAMACIVAPGGLDLVLKGAGAILALIYLLSSTNSFYLPATSFLMATSALILLGCFLLAVSWLDEKYTKCILNKMPLLNRFSDQLSQFKHSGIKIKKNVNVIIALYMLGWFFCGLQWYFIGKAMNLPITYLEFFLLHPLITALMFIPLTPAGLGIMESGTIIALGLLGIAPTTSFAFSLLVRINIILTDATGISAFLYQWKLSLSQGR